MSRKSVLVQAPASTSNCGPGFDTLSIALTLYNFVRITLCEDSVIRGVDAADGAQAMVEATTRAFSNATCVELSGFDYEIWGDVPQARGLGSSSTVRAGIVAGLNALTGSPLEMESMIRLTAQLDNAPDTA